MGPAFTLDTGDKVGVTGNSHHSRDDSDEGGTRGTQGEMGDGACERAWVTKMH